VFETRRTRRRARLDIGVVTAKKRRAMGGARWHGRAAGHPERSPFVRVASGRKFDVRLDRKVRYELDGGDRMKAKLLKVRVEPRGRHVSACHRAT